MNSAGALVACAIGCATAMQPIAGWHDPSPHRVRFVTVDRGVRLETLDWGGSGRPVVLLACYLTAHVYDDFAPKLARDFRVYGITRRGIGASDKPGSGYGLQRSADDVLAVLDSFKLHAPILVGNSCAGGVLTTLAARHEDRLGGLVYLDAADDPTLSLADYGVPLNYERKDLPPSIKPPAAPDYSSFAAYGASQRRDHGVAFPEAELRQLFTANADGSVGPSLLSSSVREAILADAKVKPDWAHVRVPVLAIFRTATLADMEQDSPPRTERERAALDLKYRVDRAMVSRWEQELLAGVPGARVAELRGANLYMFLSNEGDVLNEIRRFASGLP